MPRNKLLPLVFFCLLLPFAARAQTVLTKTGSRIVDSTYLTIDTLSIVPGTLTLDGLETTDYQVDYLHGGIRILNPEVLGKNFSFSYSCFNFDLKNPVRHRSSDLNIRQKGGYYHQLTPIVPKTEDVFAGDGSHLQSTGSIARGVSIGTNQDFAARSATGGTTARRTATRSASPAGSTPRAAASTSGAGRTPSPRRPSTRSTS